MEVNDDFSNFSFTQEGNGTTTVKGNDFFGGYNYINGGFVIIGAGSKLLETSSMAVNSGKLIIDSAEVHKLNLLTGGEEIYQNAGTFEVADSQYSGRIYLNGSGTQFQSIGRNFGYNATLSSGTILKHYGNSDELSTIDGSRMVIDGDNIDIHFGKDASLTGYANYSLDGKIENSFDDASNRTNSVTFEDSKFIFGSENNFIGSTTYIFQDSIIDLTRDNNTEIRDITFEWLSLSNANKIVFGLGFDADGNAQADKLVATTLVGGASIDFGMIRIYDANTQQAIGKTATIAVLENITFSQRTTGVYATTSYEYQFAVGSSNLDLTTVKRADGNSLNNVNLHGGLRVFSFSENNTTYAIWDDLGAMSAGEFSVIGYNSNASSSILSGGNGGMPLYSFFKLLDNDVSFIVKDLTVQEALSISSGAVLYMTNGSSATLYNTIVKNNMSIFNGGSIFAEENSLISIMMSSFTNNKARGEGGALYLTQSTALFNGMVYFADNYAKNGGGLFVLNSN
jgi:predicted outer membrane repeat protein